MADLLPLARAIELVLEHARPLPEERVALADSAGRVLRHGARARVDLPPFASSAMDGYALRAADTPGTLPIVARIPAGRPADRPLAAGEAMGIATGGVVPEGADAVVPLEFVVQKDNRISVETVHEGANVRPRAGDVTVGDEVVAAGTRIGPTHVGALVAAGVDAVVCGRRPRVAVLATGTELRAPGEPLAPGQIYDSNTPMLVAALTAAGAAVERIAPAVDDEEAHRAALERALEHDLVVTTGGVSVGPHDLVRGVARGLGVEEVFWRVSVKPGKPVSFGVRGPTLVLGLPGNPVSTLVGFELFVRPALRALEGERDPGPRYERGVLAAPLRRDAVRDQLVRARRDAGALVPLTGQESHMIARAAAADALVLVERGEGELAAGASAPFLALD